MKQQIQPVFKNKIPFYKAFQAEFRLITEEIVKKVVNIYENRGYKENNSCVERNQRFQAKKSRNSY